MAQPIRAVTGALPTSTGNFNITVSGETQTPTACIIFAWESNNASGTADDHAAFAIGFLTGSDEGATSVHSRDANSQSWCNLRTFDNSAIGTCTGAGSATTDGVATFVSFSAGTVTLNCTNAWADGWYYQAILIFASNVYAVEYNAADTNNTQYSITGAGFQPDCVFALSAAKYYDTGTSADGRISFGVATGASNQWAYSFFHERSLSTTDPKQYLHDNAFMASLKGGSLSCSFEFDSFDADGISFTVRDGTPDAGESDTYMLMVQFGDNTPKAEVIDSPNSASSDWTVVSPGNQSTFALIASSMLTAVDTVGDGVNGAMHVWDANGGSSASHKSSGQYCDEDAVGTSNTANIVHTTKALLAADDGQSTIYDADSPAFNSTSISISAANITTASATTHKWGCFTIKATVSGETISITAASMTFTGQAVTVDESIPIAAVSVAVSGQVVLTSESIPITAEVLTVSGQAVGVNASTLVPITAGTITMSGQTIAVLADTLVPITAVALTVSGQEIGVAGDVNIPVDVVSLTVGGQPITVRGPENIPVDAVSLTMIGKAVIVRATEAPSSIVDIIIRSVVTSPVEMIDELGDNEDE